MERSNTPSVKLLALGDISLTWGSERGLTEHDTEEEDDDELDDDDDDDDDSRGVKADVSLAWTKNSKCAFNNTVILDVIPEQAKKKAGGEMQVGPTSNVIFVHW